MDAKKMAVMQQKMDANCRKTKKKKKKKKTQTKQHWGDDEIQCFLALWSATEVQSKLKGAIRTKHVYEGIRKEMAAAGYQRSLGQLLNKLKKIKTDYREYMTELRQTSGVRPRKRSYFELLDSVIGNATKQATAASLNSAAAVLPNATLQEESVMLATATDPAQEPRPVEGGSPAPSCSSSTSSSRKSRKRKGDASALLQFLKRFEERFLEQSRRDQEQTTAMLENLRRMNHNSSALVGLMERMVSVLEEMATK